MTSRSVVPCRYVPPTSVAVEHCSSTPTGRSAPTGSSSSERKPSPSSERATSSNLADLGWIAARAGGYWPQRWEQPRRWPRRQELRSRPGWGGGPVVVRGRWSSSRCIVDQKDSIIVLSKARPDAKPSAVSSATSPARSTPCSNHQQPHPPRLDEHRGSVPSFDAPERASSVSQPSRRTNQVRQSHRHGRRSCRTTLAPPSRRSSACPSFGTRQAAGEPTRRPVGSHALAPAIIGQRSAA
jgi:hypothetical protein